MLRVLVPTWVFTFHNMLFIDNVTNFIILGIQHFFSSIPLSYRVLLSLKQFLNLIELCSSSCKRGPVNLFSEWRILLIDSKIFVARFSIAFLSYMFMIKVQKIYWAMEPDTIGWSNFVSYKDTWSNLKEKKGYFIKQSYPVNAVTLGNRGILVS